jgi:hypothetical protein
LSEPKEADQLVEGLHRQFSIEGQEERIVHVGRELAVRGDMQASITSLSQFPFQSGGLKGIVH